MPLTDADLPSINSSSVPGPNSLKWAKRLSEVESPDTTFLSDNFPVFWTRGSGCLVYDDDGNRFLDLTSSFGVLGVGHCHPNVVEAIHLQSATLIHGMGDVHPSTVKVSLLEKIAAHSPINRPIITLGLNGSDSVEAALKTAYLATGKPGVLAFVGGYHGLTYGTLEPTERKFFREPFLGQRGHFASHVPFGCSVEEIELAFDEAELPIGAMIVEPIQGRAGIVVPPAGWLAEISEVCRRKGALVIFDEIFTGWGRTGCWFACETAQVVPDLLCTGKGMGGGMPISACVGSSELMHAAWGSSGGEAHHTYTFLGHPLSCAAALATIKVIEDGNLVEKSRKLGLELLSHLALLADRFPANIKQVRGAGTMLGIELHRSDLAWQVVLIGLRKGLILLPAGDKGQTIEIVPPFILTDRQVVFAIDTIGQIFSEISLMS